MGDDVHCFECEEALLWQLHREKHITFCSGGGASGVEDSSGDKVCGCAAPKGREHECRPEAAAAAAAVKEGRGSTEAAFQMDDGDLDRMRRIFERAERDKRKERERNVKREHKNAAASKDSADVIDA